jgi:hypothetical protein
MKIQSFVLAGAALCGSAQATVYEFEFTATIQEMVEFEPQTFTGGAVGSSALSGNTVSVGDVVHGHFSYDTTTALFGNFGGGPMYAASGAQNSLGAHTDGGSLGLSNPGYSSTNVQVLNNAAILGGGDGFGVANLSTNATASQLMALSFFDPTGHALSDDAVPGAIDANAFSQSSFYYLYTSSTTHAMMGANGTLTSLTQVTAVPEPETYGMLLTGLAAVVWAARRRRVAR